MLILKLLPLFPHRLAECKRAAISKQTFIWTLSSRSYIILALAMKVVIMQRWNFEKFCEFLLKSSSYS